MPALAARLSRVQVAASTLMTLRARELRAQGVDVVALTLGEPGFATPRPAIEAGYQAALRGETKYPPQDGTPALKAAIQRKFRRDAGLDFALDQISVGNGGKQCIYNALAATVDPGDEVVIPVPSWNAYPLMTTLLDGTPVFVPCPQNNGFKPRAEDIEAAITPRSKWLILNNPNNPSGAACSADDLGAIAAVLRRHPQLWIMSDDMYEHLLFDGFRHATMAAVAPDLADRTVTISGVSKTYAMTGWRIGFAAGPKALIKAMVNMQGQITAGVSSVGQAAAAAALDGPQEGVDEMIAAYQRRRDIAVEMLNACPGVQCHKPEGAFYVFPNIAGCLDTTTPAGRKLGSDEDFTRALLEEAHVALVPGASYGMSPYVRVSTASEESVLVEGCRRIRTFCESLR
ncbi:MAG TPA: pyridoxal phosphate-dependent aminotransferase [Acetobacteraceae bacterium]|nr:pyridoxal phosphate-dependent aminotransferase [Acetobacteraceae bacterium]